MRPAILLVLTASCGSDLASRTSMTWPVRVGVERQAVSTDGLGIDPGPLRAGGARFVVSAAGQVLPVPIAAGADERLLEVLGTYDSGRGESLRVLTQTQASLAMSGRDLHSADFFEVKALDAKSRPLALFGGRGSAIVRILVDADPPCDVGSKSEPRSIEHEVQLGGSFEVIASGPIDAKGRFALGPIEVSYEVAEATFCAVALAGEAPVAVP